MADTCCIIYFLQFTEVSVTAIHNRLKRIVNSPSDLSVTSTSSSSFRISRSCSMFILFCHPGWTTWQYSVKTMLFSCDVIATMLILLLSLYGGLKVYQWEIFVIAVQPSKCQTNTSDWWVHLTYFECLCFRYASDISSVWSLQQTVQQTMITVTCTLKPLINS